MSNVVYIESSHRHFVVCALDENGMPNAWATQFATLEAAKAAVAAHHASYARDWELVWDHRTKGEHQSWRAGPEGELGPPYIIIPATARDLREIETRDTRQWAIIASLEKELGADGVHRLWIRLFHRLAELGGYPAAELVEDVQHCAGLATMTDDDVLRRIEQHQKAHAEVLRRINGDAGEGEPSR